MSSKKNIDDIFKEAFDGFSQAPDADMWSQIEHTLQQKKKSQKKIPLWVYASGIAAALLVVTSLSLVAYQIVTPTEKTQNAPVVLTPEQQNTTPEKFETKGVSAKVPKTEDLIKTKEKQTATTINRTTPKNNNLIKSQKSAKKVLVNSSEVTPKLSTLHTKNTNVIANQNNKASHSETSKIRNETIRDKAQHMALEDKKQNTDILKQERLTSIEHLEKNSSLDTLITDVATAHIDDLESIENELKDTNTTEDTKEKPLKKWQVQPKIAPVFFGSFGKGSAIDERFVNNNTTTSTTFSYGVAGTYAINKNFSVRGGVHKINTSYTTNNVIAYTTVRPSNTFVTSRLSNINYEASFNSLSIQNSDFLNRDNTPEFIKTQGIALGTNINHQLGFIEVPLELQYNLLDKKLGISIFSGFSTLFLSENNLFLDNDIASILVGEANNINTTSFSANFGLGFSYKVAQNVSLNIEPNLKYQINTFSNTSGNFNPYILAVYAGLGFRF